MIKKMKIQARPDVAITSGQATLRLLIACALMGVPVAHAATDMPAGENTEVDLMPGWDQRLTHLLIDPGHIAFAIARFLEDF